MAADPWPRKIDPCSHRHHWESGHVPTLSLRHSAVEPRLSYLLLPKLLSLIYLVACSIVCACRACVGLETASIHQPSHSGHWLTVPLAVAGCLALPYFFLVTKHCRYCVRFYCLANIHHTISSCNLCYYCYERFNAHLQCRSSYCKLCFFCLFVFLLHWYKR